MIILHCSLQLNMLAPHRTRRLTCTSKPRTSDWKTSSYSWKNYRQWTPPGKMDPKLGNKVYKLKGLPGKKPFVAFAHTHILHRKNIWKAFRPNVVFSMLKFHGACHYMYKSKSRTGFLDFSYFSLGSFNPGNAVSTCKQHESHAV